MKNINILLILAIATMSITSCSEDSCTFKFCETPDIDYINALSFNLDNVSAAQLETTYLVRFDKNDDFSTPIDSIEYLTASEGDSKLVLADGYPFASNGFINLNSYEEYDYIVRNTSNDFQYYVSDIEVKGNYDDCDCDYINTQKTFELNNEKLDRTNSNADVMLK